MNTSQIQTQMTRPLTTRPALIAGWLWICAGLVFVMAIIGAITRLTESGLSITLWQPVMGVIPPLTDADWAHVFHLYRQTPEYLHKNLGMTLDDFQFIYFWEWIHRLWGRLIGVVFVVPLLVFWARGFLSRRLVVGLMVLLVIGMAQGFIGWFMVQSGLIDRPSVSHYRLALHLGCALVLYALLIWTALLVQRSPRRKNAGARYSVGWGLHLHAMTTFLMMAATIIWGAFVAGLDAGLIYNEFPTMGIGRLMPPEMWHLTPWWLNLFENHAAVQFMHRALASLTVIVTLGLVAHTFLMNRQEWVFPTMAVMVLMQAGLGVATLLSGVNIYLAVLHQAGALVMLGLTTIAMHQIYYLRGTDIGGSGGDDPVALP